MDRLAASPRLPNLPARSPILPLSETPDHLQHPLVANPFGDLRHQPALMDPVEEFLQIHHPSVPISDILLRRLYRLLRRPPRTKPLAVFRKRPVPFALHYLHHRLLDESMQHCRNAKLAHSSIRLGDFHPFHRLRLIGPTQQLFPEDWPMLFQVIRRPSTVIPSTPRLPLFALTRANACLQFSRSQTSSIHCSSRAGLSVPRFAVSVSVPCADTLRASPLLSSVKANSSGFFCRLALMSYALTRHSH